MNVKRCVGKPHLYSIVLASKLILYCSKLSGEQAAQENAQVDSPFGRLVNDMKTMIKSGTPKRKSKNFKEKVRKPFYTSNELMEKWLCFAYKTK